jgi:hypothetical protein
MFDQPVSRPRAANWDNVGGSFRAAAEAEMLGVTRFFSQSYVVGGSTYTNLAEALAHGRRMHVQGASL